jgi:hypothetical protein
MSAPLCFLDIESDGVHPGRKPWDVAIIRREPDGTETEWQAFVDIDLNAADPFGLRVGRFYDRHPLGRYLSSPPGSDMPNPSAIEFRRSGGVISGYEAARLVARYTHGAHIVGAVPNFDTETLDPLLREHGLAPAWHYHLIDIEALAVGFLAGRGEPVAPPWKSDDLSLALGVKPTPEDERHTALGDARWAMRVYDAVMAGGVS